MADEFSPIPSSFRLAQTTPKEDPDTYSFEDEELDTFVEADDTVEQEAKLKAKVSSGEQRFDKAQAELARSESTGNVIAGGFLDIAEDTANAVHDAGEYISSFFGDKEDSLRSVKQEKYFNFSQELFPTTDPALLMARQTISYLAPFGAALKVFNKGTKALRFAKAAGATALVESVITDPDDARLADLVKDVPSLSWAIPEFLESEPDDSRAASRLKNALESIYVDTVFAPLAFIGEGLFKALQAKKKAKSFADVAKKLDDLPTPIPEKEGAEGVAAAAKEQVPAVPAEAALTAGQKQQLAKEIASGKSIFVEPDFKDIDFKKAADAMTIRELTGALKLRDSDNLASFLAETTRRGVQTDAMLQTNIEAILKSEKQIEQLIFRKTGTALNDAEIGALKYLAQREGTNVLNAMPMNIEFATKAELVNFSNALNRYRVVANSFEAGGTELGRAMRAIQVPANTFKEGDEAAVKLLDSYIRFNGDELQIKDIMRRVERIKKSKQQVGAAIEQAMSKGKLATAINVLEKYYLNNLLASVKTQTLAFTGNAVRAVDRLATTGLAEGLGFFTANNPMKGATYAHLKGMFQGISEGMANSRKFIENGQASIGQSSFVFDSSPVFSTTLGQGDSPTLINKFMGNFVNLVGETLALPSKGLQTTDIFFRSVSKRAHQNQLVHRDMIAMGMQPGTDDYVRNFSAANQFPEDAIVSKVDSLAASDVYMSPFSDTPMIGGENVNLGAAAAGLDQFLNNIPLGKILAPFIRISANMAEAVIERLPIVGRLNPNVRKAIQAGGADKLEQLAKTTMGTGALALFAYMGHEGHVTGSQPHTRRLRKALTGDSRFAENTIILGDTMYKYDRMDPYGLIIGLGADIGEMIAYAQSDEEKIAAEELVLSASILLGNAVTPEFMRDSVADIFAIIQSPEKANKSLLSATGFVPLGNLVRDFRKDVDPRKRDTNIPVKDINSAWEKMKASFADNIPGLSSQLPPILNVFGEEVAYPPGVGPDIASPFYINKIKAEDEALYKELTRLGEHSPVLAPEVRPGDTSINQVAMPSRTMNTMRTLGIASGIPKGDIPKIELSPEQYHRLIKLSSQGLKKDLRTVISLEGYAAKKEAVKKMMIGKIIIEHQKQGRLKFMAEFPSLQDKLTTQGTELQKEFIEIGVIEKKTPSVKLK